MTGHVNQFQLFEDLDDLDRRDPGAAATLLSVDVLSPTRIAPDMLELEFTESAIARDPDRVIAQLRELRASGMAIAIDDFGTGHSNLSYLQQLPVSVLKIDQAFIRNMATSDKDRLLVKTMIAMGRDLGYRVVGEGIETQAVYDMLGEWGCDEGQGYLMARPMPPEQVFAETLQAA